MNALKGIFYIFTVFLVLFLVLINSLQLRDVKTLNAKVEKESRVKTRTTALLVRDLIEAGAVSKEEPYPLFELAKKYGLYRILITDEDALPVNDTLGESGEKLPKWLTPDVSKGIVGGNELYVPFDKNGVAYAAYHTALKLRDGPLVLTLVMEKAVRTESASDTFLVVVIGSLLFFSFIYVFLRVFSTNQKKSINQENEPTEVGFVVDTFHEMVAKLKQKEKELEELRGVAERRADTFEEYNENILQSVPSGVISVDEDLRIVKVNTPAERILEISAEGVTGKDCRDVLNRPPDELLSQEGEVRRGDMHYVTPSGKGLWLGYSISPLLDRERKPIGRLLVFTDLTELKTLETQAALRQRLSSLGEMAAGIAHELRNPMGVISGYAKMLSKKVDDTLKGSVESIIKEIAVMDTIITDFLSFAKAREPHFTEVNIHDIVEASLRSVLREDMPIRIKLNIDKGLTIAADELQIRQAFNNLIQNAVDAMQDGGELEVSASVETERVDIKVSDTGHGIPEAIREKIFQPFYTTKDKGTGLGMAVVHRIITTHGGYIEIQDREGGGTVMSISLPIKQPLAAA